MTRLRPFLYRQLPLVATSLVLVLLYATAATMYEGFLSWRVVGNLLSDNAFLGIAAVGMTLVIFSGGIDLSVGAVVGFTSILTATLIVGQGWPAPLAWAAALLSGSAIGAAQGALIQLYRLPAFLITLAGLFFARGLGFWINTESVGINDTTYRTLSGFRLLAGPVSLSSAALTLLVVVLLGWILGHFTRFGRNLLAIGSNETSALLMGVPLASTKIAVYTLNGAFAALAGIVATLYTGSGNPSMGIGLELDAIAVVVIGGTLLSGGRGHILGTLLGLLIFGTIQMALLFDGRLSSWWMRIVVGALLLLFILLQRALLRKRG